MRNLLVRLAALVAMCGGGNALADAPCLGDAARFCPGIPTGDGRLWACLTRNQFQLSSACVQNLREMQRRASEFSADCIQDVHRFCPGTQPGGLRILECLGVHVGRRELSTNCEDAVATALEKIQQFAIACADEAATLCQGVQPGGGRLFVCLRSQMDGLSSRCRRALEP